MIIVKDNKKAFTLIELLAVIIILGVLMLIAIPSVTEYIGVAKRKAYISSAKEYIGATANKVNSLDLPITDTNTTYYVPIASIDLESGGKSPYGEWTDAYVVVTTDGTTGSDYYWTSLDENGNAVLLTEDNKLTNDSITTNVDELDLNVGVGERDDIVVFNEDGTEQAPKPALSYIEDGGSIAEGTTIVPKPVITLTGASSLEVAFGSTYTDLGATATDDTDGNITASIVTTNGVNTNTLGVQYVRYNVTNSKGITAVEVVRTVTVSAIVNPGYIASEGVNSPMLINGLTAVKWNSGSSTWDSVADPNSDTSWYNYANKEWANAKSADGSMWVWIPRYIYKIAAANWHTGTAGTISIQFSQGTNDNWNSGAIGNIDTGFGVNASNNKWTNHPAFKFGSTELTGIWVAKFEASGTAASIDVKPNVASLGTITFNTMFNASRNMETNSKYGWSLASGLQANGIFSTDTNNLDTHMMKNSEWGAVAYLAQSAYGKNAEVWINPNSSATTGCAGASVSAASAATCNAYNTANGGQASTTGNIYGIYDMSGASWEYVAAYVNDGSVNLTNNAPALLAADSKYKEMYAKASTESRVNNYNLYKDSFKGDANYETSSGTGASGLGWYSDHNYMAAIDGAANEPIVMRGGGHTWGVNSGIFSATSYTGVASFANGFRPVLLVNLGL